ncbi:hypothetical protein BDZ45DRAFT_749326 [Acephala macrosclerotiorum]|nr:hypothetical protein BDZ45DRAFT_749326 [Acephala macrosclerotiorum]
MTRQTKSTSRKAPAPNLNDLPRSRATSVEPSSPNKGQGIIAKGMTKVKKEYKKLKLVFTSKQVDAYQRQQASTSQAASVKLESNNYQENQKYEVGEHLATTSSDSDEIGSPLTSARDTLESGPSSSPSENTPIKSVIKGIANTIKDREITPEPSLKALGKRKAEFISKGDEVKHATQQSEQTSKKQKINIVSGSGSENDQAEVDSPLPNKVSSNKRKAEFVSDDVSEGYGGGYITPLYLINEKKQKVEAVHGPTIKDEEQEEVDFSDAVSEGHGDGYLTPLYLRNEKKQKAGAVHGLVNKGEEQEEVTVIKYEESEVEDVFDEISKHEEHEATPPPSEKALGKRKENELEIVESATNEYEEHVEREDTPPPSEKALGKRKDAGVTEIVNEEGECEISPVPSKKAVKKARLAVVTFTTNKIKGVEEAVVKRVTYFNSPRGTQQSNSYLVKKLSTEVHNKIFKYLGPATQRILGATCRGLYDIYKNNHHEKAIVVSWSEDKFFSRRNPNKSTPYIEIIQDWILPSYVRTFAQTKEKIDLKYTKNFKEIYFKQIRKQLTEKIEAKQEQIDEDKKKEAAAAAYDKWKAEDDARKLANRVKAAARKAEREKEEPTLGVKDAKVTKNTKGKKRKGSKNRKGGKAVMNAKTAAAMEKQVTIKEEIVVAGSTKGVTIIEKSEGAEVIENVGEKSAFEADTTKAMKNSLATESIASSSKNVVEMKPEEKGEKEVVPGPKVWKNPKLTERVKSWIGFLKL